MNDFLTHIPRLLRSIRRRQKTVWSAAALLLALGLALLLLAATATVEALAWLDPEPRGLMLALAATLAGGLLLAAVVGIVVLWGRRRSPSDDHLAHVVWERDDEIRDRVLDALDLARRDDPNSSAALRAAAIRQADQLAEGVDPARYVDRRPLRKAARFAGALAGVVVLTLLIGGGSLIDAAGRLAHPGREYIKPGTVFLALELPDSVRIVQGDTLDVAVRARHSRPRNLDLVIDEGAGSERVLDLLPDRTDTMLFTARVPDLRRDASLWARQGRRARSDTSRVKVISRPRIARLNVSVTPPRYTGLDPIHLPEGVGDLTALPGSRVDIAMRASRPLADARLLIASLAEDAVPDTIPLDPGGEAVTADFRLRRPGRWWLEFTSADSIAAGDPLVWSLNTADDLRPRVEIHSPEDGSLIPEALRVPLAVAADDDYGISRMRLRYRVHSSMFGADSVAKDQYNGFDLPLERPAPGQAIAAVRWSLEDLPLLPTDEVHFFVEVWDNDSWAGPKRTRSELRRLVFPSVDELYAMTEQTESDVGDELRKAHEQAEKTRQKLEETLTRLRSNPEDMSWDEARALQQALDQQEQSLEQMRQVSESLEQMRQAAEEHDLMNRELLDKYQRLQELIRDLQSPEMAEAMEKLREAMENLDGEQMREALEEMMQDQDKLMESLDRNLAILEQLKAERRMDELASRAEDLAQRQEQITEQLEQATPQEMERLAEEQESIREQSDDLAEQLEQASEEMEEMDRQAAADSLGQMSEEMKQQAFSEPMKRSAEQMRRGQRQQSKQSSQQAQKKLQQMSQRLRGMQEEMVQQNQRELAAEMNRVFQAVLVVSRQQEELRRRSATLGVASPRYRELAADQEALISGMNAVDRDVAELMKKTFFVGANVAGNVARARAQMMEAIRRYTDRRPQEVTGAQTEALAFLHRGLRALNQSQQQMQGSGSSTGYEEMMKQLEQMSQQQQGINQQSGQMPMPMPGGTPGGGLQQLAARQRALAEQMRQMESDARSMEEIMGNLDGLSGDMEEVADDLEDRNVSERTRRLQQRILQRLLDSQRSLQEKERSKQRQGQLADDLPRSSPGDLPIETEDELRRRLLEALEGDYARAWRETIRDYYRALERDRRESPPPASSGP